MIRIEGTIETPHGHPECVAAALEPDNLTLIRTCPVEGGVRAGIDGTKLRSIHRLGGRLSHEPRNRGGVSAPARHGNGEVRSELRIRTRT
jgi:hypothetical protein